MRVSARLPSENSERAHLRLIRRRKFRNEAGVNTREGRLDDAADLHAELVDLLHRLRVRDEVSEIANKKRRKDAPCSGGS